MLDINITGWRKARTNYYYGDFQVVVSIWTEGSGHGLDETFDPWKDKLEYLPLEIDDVRPHLIEPGMKSTVENLVPGLPTANNILQIIQLAQRLEANAKVLLHCAAGKSRSPSAAAIMLRATGETDADSIATIFSRRRRAHPNGWMLKLADIIMDSHLFETCSQPPYRVKWK